MGRIKKGQLSGLVGELVFVEWKGRQVVRKRRTVTPPPTSGQERQRSKLSIVNAFLKDIKKLVAVGFQASDKISSYNECVSEFLRNAVKTENGNLVIDYPQIKISRGEMPKPEILSVETLPDSVRLTWRKDTRVTGSKKNDEAVVLLYPETGSPVIYDCIGLRSEGGGVIPIPLTMSRPFHAWIFFNNPRLFPYESKQKVSDSVYLGVA